jgi:tRNA A-37 threonylcarbamoyl transferase component Bud32
MPDDLIDRISDDLAAGRSVDWAAVMASAMTPAERRQLESLRLVHQMSLQGHPASETVAVADTVPVGPPALANTVAATQAVWGRYLLVHEAGAGSFGIVYRAKDPVINLDVAIKVLHRHVDNVRLRERLVREGRALARIQHQNVVRVLGVEFNGDRAGLCTEFIEGDTLETEVRSHGTLSQTQAIEVGKALCQALTAVHRAGFVHRDVKARNVMRERDTGRIVLMDFGTGREIEDELASRALGIAGTAIYMAPEVLANQPASHSSDVYSLGVLLYYVLTGAYPVEGNSIEAIRTAHLKGLRTRLGDRRPDLSPAFLRVVEKALAPKRSRYATPAAFLDDLEAVYTERPRWLQRLRLASAMTAVSLGGLLVLGFINTFYFNVALGRADFVDEGLGDWLKWGAKSVLAPIVIAAFTVLAATLILECAHLLARVSATARTVERFGARVVHRWSLDDVAVLSSLSFLSSAAVLFAAWWYFTPLLGTLTDILPDIATVSFERLTLLSPDFGTYHSLYRKTFVGTTIACVMLWYPTVRMAVRTRQRVPRRAVVGGSIVLGFSLILLDFPYRLLAHDIDFDEVTWEGRSCHVLGARGDERLIFCPSLAVPRGRIVTADVLAPLQAGPVEWWKAGSVEAKRKKSIFKFLLNPPVNVREGLAP